MPNITNTMILTSPLRKIRFEAESRMAKGILVNGSPFRCDETSSQRMGEIVQAFTDGVVDETEGVQFITAAGVLMTLTSETQARQIFDAMRHYRQACLAASANLQTDPPTVVSDDAHWPVPGSITV
ncbi:MAG TPA: hypothetical protein DCL95_14455 [Rhodospirillaceae bacterium]|nr:hypothetical protein [Rhodospirillaceae bacterium]MAX63490.1 hypothetical protein [Rhodospirillaceae bacterium]MBB56439.1 hypothetical protein [Rhodospirillaceae bacterium]HAE02167.1 hypothetical protein [Rhodospirillaceae bacterium]HAJ21233.1 hypothetical protein [Rhodospirillaceae bacterium]|tara:strand:- start:456 stop:833 length:378 start_codon:yes stop_codon:yes gene_type:complete